MIYIESNDGKMNYKIYLKSDKRANYKAYKMHFRLPIHFPAEERSCTHCRSCSSPFQDGKYIYLFYHGRQAHWT